MPFRLVRTGRSVSDQESGSLGNHDRVDSDSIPEGYCLKRPDAGIAIEELQEIEERVEREGYVLLWSRVLRDLVAFYCDEKVRGKIPPAFVPYSEAELRELFGGSKLPVSTLRLIHEAKRHGANVIRRSQR